MEREAVNLDEKSGVNTKRLRVYMEQEYPDLGTCPDSIDQRTPEQLQKDGLGGKRVSICQED